MIFRILIVGSDEKLASFVNAEKERIIPKEWQRTFQERGVSLTASAFVTTDNKLALYNEIVRLREKAEGLIIMHQPDSFVETKLFSRSCFVRQLGIGGNIQNMLSKNIALVLRQFALFSALFDQMKYKQIFLLPFGNFGASDFIDLCNLLSDGAGDFCQRLPRIVDALKRRQRPKRTYPVIYYVDDNELFFRYGHEKHARVEVTEPPHNRNCALNSDFRYGRRYDPDRHFNVSIDKEHGHFSHTFVDCHGGPQSRDKVTHFNIFPNGFVA